MCPIIKMYNQILYDQFFKDSNSNNINFLSFHANLCYTTHVNITVAAMKTILLYGTLERSRIVRKINLRFTKRLYS